MALCRLLLAEGIAIEAGLWSVQAVATFLDSGLAAHCLRVLVEAQKPDPVRAVATAHAIDRLLVDARIALPQVHHGEGLATRAVIEAALARGRDMSDRARGYHTTARWACRALQCGVGDAGRGAGPPLWATAPRHAWRFGRSPISRECELITHLYPADGPFQYVPQLRPSNAEGQRK